MLVLKIHHFYMKIIILSFYVFLHKKQRLNCTFLFLVSMKFVVTICWINTRKNCILCEILVLFHPWRTFQSVRHAIFFFETIMYTVQFLWCFAYSISSSATKSSSRNAIWSLICFALNKTFYEHWILLKLINFSNKFYMISF